MNDVTGFFAYARERYSILLRRREGRLPPWTEDPVLAAFSFCNVFREDDKTTAWFRENVRDPLRNDLTHVSIATVAFRWFNRIETGEHIKDILLTDGWNERAVRRAVRGLHPLLTGAYIIMPRPGLSVNKLDGICWCMARLTVEGLQCYSLEQAHQELMQSPGMGPFMAYEVITDLRYTSVLDGATDIMAWANAGPGAKRGLVHVFGPHSPRMQLTLMQELLGHSQDRRNWPTAWPNWDMRTVEHTLCEYAKYCDGKLGKRLKRRYHYEKS